MSNKYFIAIAKEKYDCWYQDMHYIGIYETFPFALEQVRIHNKEHYFYGCREFDYYIFTSNINEKIIMEEKDSIYSLTSKMCEEHIEYVTEEYAHFLHK